MNAYVARKLAEFAASILILVPCVLLLAWETALPNATFLWAVLLACSGVFLAALIHADRCQEQRSWRRVVSRCGGFVIMFLFILYKVICSRDMTSEELFLLSISSSVTYS